MPEVMILKQIVRDGLAMAHEAIGEEMMVSGYGYKNYCGMMPGQFLERYFDLTPIIWLETLGDEKHGLEDFFLGTVEYKKKNDVHFPHPSDVMSAKGFKIIWLSHEAMKQKFYFPASFYYENKTYALKDFLGGALLPWDQQSEVCTQSAHSTNPVATLENALNQTDFKRKIGRAHV